MSKDKKDLSVVKNAGKVLTDAALKTIQKQALNKAANKAAAKPTKKEWLKKAAGVAGDVMKAAAPELAGMIPVAGPLLKTVLSTLNDDEWFGKFVTAGATFNELLDVNSYISKDSKHHHVSLVGAYVMYTVNILDDKAGAITTWKTTMLPSILAYVRDKTNNVLNGSEDNYWSAFVYASKLYALLYTIRKYIKLSADLPLNIPALTSQLVVCKPEDYSAWKGVADSLELYLRDTIKLPYAWTQYLRWRFGTTFLSSNTGKPGLVFYDYNVVYTWDSQYTTVAGISTVIEQLKGYITAAGRATADINLAYKDHDVKFDVEDRHYDEKEFNLRTNFTANWLSDMELGGDNLPGRLICMDSRLDSSAAIQAVTLSTKGSDNLAPFSIVKTTVGFYVPEKVSFKCGAYYAENPPTDINLYPGDSGNTELLAGWHSVEVPSQVSMLHICVAELAAKNAESEGEEKQVRADDSNVGHIFEHFAAVNNVTQIGNDLNEELEKYIAKKALDSLEVHGARFEILAYQSTTPSTLVPAKYLNVKPLAYDTAYVTHSQISSIHRMAVRNLTRGDYKTKVALAKKEDVIEAKEEVIELAQDEITKEI